VECKTYRIHGHFEGDPQTYKPPEEVEAWKKRDPIQAFRKSLLEMDVLNEDSATTIEGSVADQIDEAVKFAENSPFPAPEAALEDVFV
jgi:pyruvate dehydrogenase E1 component alpha subunit